MGYASFNSTSYYSGAVKSARFVYHHVLLIKSTLLPVSQVDLKSKTSSHALKVDLIIMGALTLKLAVSEEIIYIVVYSYLLQL